MKTFIISLISLFITSSLLVSLVVLNNEEKKMNDQLKEYGMHYLSGQKNYEFNDFDNSLLKKKSPNKLPHFSGNVSSNEDRELPVVAIKNKEKSERQFNHVRRGKTNTSSVPSPLSNSGNYSHKAKEKYNNSQTSANGGIVSCYTAPSGNVSESQIQSYGFIALHANSNINILSDNVGSQDIGTPVADPGRGQQILSTIPVPEGLFVVLLLSIFYSFCIFIQRKR